MQLRSARLCLDCEEVHDAQRCPACASEMFTYITRWVPAPERRSRPRPETPSPQAEAYKHLVSPPPPPSLRGRRMLTRGAFGLTALGIAGLLWRRKPDGSDR